jgi:hypothetical protein
MNKLTLGLATLGIILISSCSKEDEENKIFQIIDIIGLWEQTGGKDFVTCPAGNNAKIEITETDYIQFFTNNEGCLTKGSLLTKYEFDGKVIYTVDGRITLRVLSADANSLYLSDGKQTNSYSRMLE